MYFLKIHNKKLGEMAKSGIQKRNRKIVYVRARG